MLKQFFFFCVLSKLAVPKRNKKFHSQPTKTFMGTLYINTHTIHTQNNVHIKIKTTLHLSNTTNVSIKHCIKITWHLKRSKKYHQLTVRNMHRRGSYQVAIVQGSTLIETEKNRISLEVFHFVNGTFFKGKCFCL